MARFDTEEEFDAIKSQVAGAIEGLFPIESGSSRLTVTDVQVQDPRGSSKISEQKKAMLGGRSWDVPVYGKVSLERDGKVVDERRVLLGRLPKLTERYGFIVKGKEYQSYTQFRQRSGVYHRCGLQPWEPRPVWRSTASLCAHPQEGRDPRKCGQLEDQRVPHAEVDGCDRRGAREGSR